MRCLLFMHTNPEYIINFRLPLLKEVRSRGYSVVALAPGMQSSHVDRLEREGIRAEGCELDPTGMNPLADFRHMLALAGRIRSYAPQLVLTNNIKPVIFGTFAAVLARVPNRYALVSGLGYAFTDGASGSEMRRRFLRFVTSILYALAFRLNRCVIFQNQDDIREMVGKGLCPKESARCVSGSGVDTTEYTFVEVDGKPVFIMVARLLYEKGVREYLVAARSIKSQYPDVRLLLIGGADKNPGALSAAEITRLATEGVIEWLGEVADVRPWLRQASVFVLPSYREGLPRSTLEAMSSGLAIVTTDVPGCRETVVEGVNGFKVPVRNAGRLTEAMERFVANPTLARTMGRESRRIAETRFAVNIVNREMCDIMDLQPQP